MGLASPFHYSFCTLPVQTDLDGALACFDPSFCMKKIEFRCGCVEVLLFAFYRSWSKRVLSDFKINFHCLFRNGRRKSNGTKIHGLTATSLTNETILLYFFNISG